jgi:hypothetical protein
MLICDLSISFVLPNLIITVAIGGAFAASTEIQ